MADRVCLVRASARAAVSVRMVRGQPSHWIGQALGIAWREEPLRLHHQDGYRWWSSAPDVWLIDFPVDQAQSTETALATAAPLHAAMVTMVGDAWGRLQVSGSEAAIRDLLERAGPVGVDALNGRCVATRFGAFAVTLFEVPSADPDPVSPVRRIELQVERPSLKSFEQWLQRVGAVLER